MLTSGSLTASNIAPAPSEYGFATDKISFDYTYNLPANLMEGFKEGWLAIDLGGNYGPNYPGADHPGMTFALDWIPSRITAMGFAIVGNFEDAAKIPART